MSDDEMKKIKRLSNLIVSIFSSEDLNGADGLQVIFNILFNTCAKNKITLLDLKSILEDSLRSYPEFLKFYSEENDDPT